MSITASNLTDFAPELASLPGPQIALIVAHANMQLDVDAWGDWLAMGQLNLAAHLGTMAKRKGAAGALQSQSVGQVSQAFFQIAGAQILSTSYGQEYARLVSNLNTVRGPWVI